MTGSRYIYCAVVGCKSQKTADKLSFFKLPKDEERRKIWLKLIGRLDLITTRTKPTSHTVCSLHFERCMIRNIPQLKADAIPTKLIPNQTNISINNSHDDCKDVSTQTEESSIRVLSAVTAKTLDLNSTSCIQTTSENTQNGTKVGIRRRKCKHRYKFRESDRKRRKLEIELEILRKQLQSKESE